MSSSILSRPDQIRQAVVQLVGQEGMAGLTMKKVAQAADLSPGTLYLYYASKEEMISRLFVELKQGISKAGLMGIDTSAPFRTVFRQVWFNIFAYMRDHQAEVTFTQQYLRSPFADTAVMQETEAYMGLYLNMMTQGIAEEAIKNEDPRMLLTFVWGVLLETSASCLYFPEDAQHAVAQAAFRFCWDGIRL